MYVRKYACRDVFSCDRRICTRAQRYVWAVYVACVSTHKFATPTTALCVCTHEYVCVCTYEHACVCTHKHVCVYAQACVCVCVECMALCSVTLKMLAATGCTYVVCTYICT